MHIALVIAAAALVICAVICAAGFIYQVLGSRRDRVRFSACGRSIDIGNGHQLYLLEKGAGGPTVLFEAGIAATNLNWFHIQENVAEFTHTVSYDRGGLGWSGPSSTARTPANCAAELNRMLHRAGIKPPFVLVGHSFGGLVMRRYALDYPADVAGVVLVDPMRCEEWPPNNPLKLREVNRGKRLTGYAVPIARFGLARLALNATLGRAAGVSPKGGVAHRASAPHKRGAPLKAARSSVPGPRHVINRVTEEVGKMPRETWPMIAAHWSRPGYYVGMRNHLIGVPDTVREMRDAAPIRDIPVVLLTPSKATPLSDDYLARIATNVQQVIVPTSAHWIHLDQPELVIDSIRAMVAAVSVGHSLR